VTRPYYWNKKVKSKAIPLQAYGAQRVLGRLRLPDSVKNLHIHMKVNIFASFPWFLISLLPNAVVQQKGCSKGGERRHTPDIHETAANSERDVPFLIREVGHK
jgi:hypothetical protein